MIYFNEFKRLNILLVSMTNRNLSDAVITDCTYAMISKAMALRFPDNYIIYPYDFRSDDDAFIQCMDMIVFAGGGMFRFKSDDMAEHVHHICACADKAGIPVFFNAIGVEDYDENNEQCRLLAEALAMDCVKGITVRDVDKAPAGAYLQGKRKKIYPVMDSSVLAPLVYDITRKADSDVIGIGVVSYEMFAKGSGGMSKQEQLDMWKKLLDDLEYRGIRWQMFVNGLQEDYDFALEILDYVGKADLREEYLLPRPVEPKELVEIIASFQALLTFRMQTWLVAYALGVPSIGMIWSERLKLWGKKFGYQDRLLPYHCFNADDISAALGKCMTSRVKVKENTSSQKRGFRVLRSFLYQYGSRCAERKDKVHVRQVEDWSERLVANALGGKSMLYRNMNSSVGLKESFRAGFRHVEIDMRLTLDRKLVCVRDWSEEIYRKLGVDPRQYGAGGMLHADFMDARYEDGHFKTMDFKQLLARMILYPELNVVFDLGILNEEDGAECIRQLAEEFDQNPDLYKRCMIRMYTERSIKQFRASGYPFLLIFRYADHFADTIPLEEAERICKENHISWVALPKKRYNEHTRQWLRNMGVHYCVFSCQKMGEIMQLVQDGADLVYTDFMTVDRMCNALRNSEKLPEITEVI